MFKIMYLYKKKIERQYLCLFVSSYIFFFVFVSVLLYICHFICNLNLDL